MDFQVLLLGLAIFCFRIIDVSVSTIRIISTVNSRIKLSFLLGLVEVSVWVFMISATLSKIKENPWIVVFYALGFSTGNVVGILIEKKIPLGNVTLRIFVKEKDMELTRILRDQGFAVTVFDGSGRDGRVSMLYCFTRKRHLPLILDEIKSWPEVFYILDYGGDANRFITPRSEGK